MKITIVTPCFNSEAFIAETIESVLFQRGNFDLEYLVVDGASTDRTFKIAQDYKQMLETGKLAVRCRGAVMHCVSEKDTGMYDALAKGLHRATGDIIGYLNADDFYLPNGLSVLADVFRAHPKVKWLSAMPLRYNEKGQIFNCYLPFVYDRDLIRKGMYGSCLPHIQQESTFWRRELLETLDYSKLKSYKYAGDFYLWHSFARQHDLHIVESCIGGFRRRTGQLSSVGDRYHEEFRQIASPAGVFDKCRAAFLKKGMMHFSNGIKKRLNKNIVSFDGHEWKI